MSGKCHCGVITVEFNAEPIFSVFCHCTQCQRKTGAPFIHWIGFKPEEFILFDPESVIVAYRTSDSIVRYGCGRCITPIYNHSDGAMKFFDIPAGIVEKDQVVPAKLHIHYENAVVELNDGLMKYKADYGGEIVSLSVKL
jgi:hypothetical protein